MPFLRVALLVTLCLVVCSPLLASPQITSTLDWKSLEENWKKYLENSTDDQLDVIMALLADKGKIADAATTGAPVVKYVMENLGILESQIYEKNIKAVRLGFRLYSIAYGTYEESLAKIIGNLIGFDALLFLQELQTNMNILPSLEMVVGSFRFASSTPEEKEIERKYRIKMLEVIKDKSVKDIRSECLKILNRLK